MNTQELKEQVNMLGEVLEKLQGQFTEAIEAAYRDGAGDGYYAADESVEGLLTNLWLDSETKRTIDTGSL